LTVFDQTEEMQAILKRSQVTFRERGSQWLRKMVGKTRYAQTVTSNVNKENM